MDPVDGKTQTPPPQEDAVHPAREMSRHLLRMVETRLEAAGLVAQLESQRFVTRLQLKVLAWVALFLALWAGIVLLAIVIPPHLRVPVLSAVVALFVILTIVALIVAARMKRPGREAGSLAWFLESLKADFEILGRSLGARAAEPTGEPSGEPPGEPPTPDPPAPEPPPSDTDRSIPSDRAA